MNGGIKGNGGEKTLFGRPTSFWLNGAVIALCYVALALVMVLAVSPERYDLAVGDIAPKTITATKEVVDEVTTELRRERAAENVPPSYKEDDEAFDRVMDHFTAIFDDFEAVRAYGEGIRTGTIRSAAGVDTIFSGAFTRADLNYAADLCVQMELSDWQLSILMKQTATDLGGLYANTSGILRKTMETTIREGQLETAIANIQRQVIQYTSSDLCWNIAIPAVRASLEPNMIVDQDATEAAREAAWHDVEPSLYKSGQNIVVAGERVTSAQLAMLESLGLLEGNRLDLQAVLGVLGLTFLALVALLFYIFQFEKQALSRPKNALILATIFLLTTGTSLLAAQLNSFLAPASMAALLIAALLSPGLAVMGNLLALILVGIVTNPSTAFAQQMLYVFVSGALSAPVGVYVLKWRQRRASVLLAGVLMAVVNFLNMTAIGLLTNNEMLPVLSDAVWSAGGCLLASLLCVGVQPALEGIFDLMTPYKLMELANPNQPLLRRLLVETPGTYHHSILVSNLAEAAAEAIGADALLTRVGAYYHDIGKLKRPQYFTENQLGENPHDLTDPRVSAAIIAEHVSDGVQLARQNRLPERVIDFISQHHGDTLISFFYHKMLGMEGGEAAQIEDFQYPGPKPATAETAILMLADTVEAAVRAGGEQTPQTIERRVRELVKEKVDDGQLNDSPLRFGDISRIVHAFTQVLTGLYHKRIEYPKLDSIKALLAQKPALQATETPSEEASDAP